MNEKEKNLVETALKEGKGLTVITGNNGTGKTTMLKEIEEMAKKENKDCLFLDVDSHCQLNQSKLKEFADDLIKESKAKNIFIVSLRKEIIDIADVLIELK
ncbi:AAA family ATPase [bacterium]|nr:AAA family ATPase [bacterium]